MKLLLFIHSLSCGGAERVTSNLANHWARAGWCVDLVTIAPRSADFYPLDTRVHRHELRLSGTSGNLLVGGLQNLRRIRALRQLLRELRPDVALAMMSTSNVLLALATFGLRRPVVIGSERNHPPRVELGRFWRWLRRVSYSRLAAVVALASTSAVWLEENTTARRVTVIPNVASYPLLDMPPRLDVRAIVPAGRQMLLAVGRLEPQKGFDDLIAAFAPLAAKHPDWDLVILGEGHERARLATIVDVYGVAGRVLLPGQAGNIGNWYERASLFVLSSRFEGFPNTLAEALAYGVPAVAFDCDTGPRDIVRDGIDGLLVPAADIAALSAALDRLMGDAPLRVRFAERAVEARKRFASERIVARWEELFTELSDRRT